MIARDDQIKIIGSAGACEGAKELFGQLLELAKRGNEITEQNVNYALALLAEHNRKTG